MGMVGVTLISNGHEFENQLWEMVNDREALHAAVSPGRKSQNH